MQFSGLETPSLAPALGGNNWSLKGINKRLGFSSHTFRGLKYMRVRAGEALIGLSLYNERYNSVLLLELKMAKREEHWRLIEVSNLPSFLCQIIELEHKRVNDSFLDES